MQYYLIDTAGLNGNENEIRDNILEELRATIRYVEGKGPAYIVYVHSIFDNENIENDAQTIKILRYINNLNKAAFVRGNFLLLTQINNLIEG